jgi:hypothetical protein
VKRTMNKRWQLLRYRQKLSNKSEAAVKKDVKGQAGKPAAEAAVDSVFFTFSKLLSPCGAMVMFPGNIKRESPERGSSLTSEKYYYQNCQAQMILLPAFIVVHSLREIVKAEDLEASELAESVS